MNSACPCKHNCRSTVKECLVRSSFRESHLKLDRLSRKTTQYKTTANSQNCQQLFYIFNADGETRTRKDIMPHAPQACAYTNSATSALSGNLRDFWVTS